MKQITFNNLIYTKDNKTGYYNNSKTHKRLHRAIWEYYNGKIPKGYEIHHKDQNKDNNDISNLELLSKNEHIEKHKRLLTNEQRQWRKNNLNNNARPKAIEWHKSKDGRKWYKEHYYNSLGNLEEQSFICLNCGIEYKAINHGNNKFCSNNCKSVYRRKSGLDSIEKECAICGRRFTTNKYRQAIWCKNCKGKKH